MVTGYADSFGSLGHLKVATNWLNSNLRAHSGQEPPNSWEIPEHVFLAFHSFFFFSAAKQKNIYTAVEAG